MASRMVSAAWTLSVSLQVVSATLLETAVLESDVAALAADDQCEVEGGAEGYEQCALNALQVRVEAADSAKVENEAIAEGWPFFGSTEKCCRCKTGTVGWSATGKCSFCEGKVAKTKSVGEKCQKKSKTFKGSQVCANSCRAVVGALLQVSDVGTERVGVEGDAMSDEGEYWSIFGTTEKCCKCKNGDVGWSASGKCSFCKEKVATMKSVGKECQKTSKTFKGSQVCANSCRKVVGALLQVDVVGDEGVDAHDEAIAHEEENWPFFGTTEKCCKCKTGVVGWSATGKCSFCKGKVALKKDVPKDCRKKSKTFRGNKACANACRKVVGGGSSSRRWR